MDKWLINYEIFIINCTILKRVIIPLFFAVFTQIPIAQNVIKQGKIYYEMDFPDIPADQKKLMASMLPKDATA